MSKKVRPTPFSGHVHAHLPDEVVEQMNEAWDDWQCSKKDKKGDNDIIDAYLLYAKLMRHHVDPGWS